MESKHKTLFGWYYPTLIWVCSSPGGTPFSGNPHGRNQRSPCGCDVLRRVSRCFCWGVCRAIFKTWYTEVYGVYIYIILYIYILILYYIILYYIISYYIIIYIYSILYTMCIHIYIYMWVMDFGNPIIIGNSILMDI